MVEKNILIADDDQSVLEFLREMLQAEGYRVFLAQNGQEAVATVQNNPIDMAILDLKMPIMDGVEALKNIKKLDQNIEVLIMTAYADLESMRQTIIEHGAFDYLTKPFHQSEILHITRNALVKRELISQNNQLKQDLQEHILKLEKDFEERTHQLRESQIKYKEIVENSNDAIVVAQDEKLKFVNLKTLELTDYSLEEILDIRFMDLVHPDDCSMVIERHIKRLQGEDLPTTYSFRALKKNRESFWVEINAIRTIWEGKPATLNFIRDISDRKKTKEKLEESEKRYRLLAENITDVIWMYDLNLKPLYISPSIERLSGYSVDEAMDTSLVEILTHDSLEIAGKAFSEGQAIEKSDERDPTRIRTIELELTCKDGSSAWTESRISYWRDHEGRPLGIIGVTRDITKKKLTMEALRRSESRLNDAQQIAHIGSFDRNFIKEDLYWSDEQYRIWGYEPGEISPSFDLIKSHLHPQDIERFEEAHEAALAKLKPYDFEFNITHKNGGIRTVHSKAKVEWDETGKPKRLFGTLQDITEEKKLEAQVQQLQKMEAIGTLAGGIAHDFNNLLMAIQGYASLMLLGFESDHPCYKHLNKIEKNVRMGADLTKQLLGFARKGKYEVKSSDLTEMVIKTSNMFGRTRKEIAIHPKYEKDLWMVEVDQSQIEQVLLNVYINAWQAMPGGGDLYLETENVHLADGYCKSHNIEPGNYVKISITDTGVGIDEATRERIFEPFFTTKEMGRGTGLGLASVYGIIKNHSGIIDVYSKKGEGTTFHIYLPSSGKKAISIREKKMPETILRGTETILLVDDEDMIIDIGEQLLKEIGYKVFIARSGKEAIEIYKENQNKIDMVLIDMIMPGMGGGETYDILKSINPDIKVLLSSGYSISGRATEILERGCDGFIQKPFNLKELSNKIGEILDKKES